MCVCVCVCVCVHVCVCQCVHMCVRARFWLHYTTLHYPTLYTHSHTHTHTHTHTAAADKVERGEAESGDSKFISFSFFILLPQAAADKVKRGEAEAGDFKFVLGHAGWGPGQLEGEIKNQTWLVAGMCICMYVCICVCVCVCMCVCVCVCVCLPFRVYICKHSCLPCTHEYACGQMCGN